MRKQKGGRGVQRKGWVVDKGDLENTLLTRINCPFGLEIEGCWTNRKGDKFIFRE